MTTGTAFNICPNIDNKLMDRDFLARCIHCFHGVVFAAVEWFCSSS